MSRSHLWSFIGPELTLSVSSHFLKFLVHFLAFSRLGFRGYVAFGGQTKRF